MKEKNTAGFFIAIIMFVLLFAGYFIGLIEGRKFCFPLRPENGRLGDENIGAGRGGNASVTGNGTAIGGNSGRGSDGIYSGDVQYYDPENTVLPTFLSSDKEGFAVWATAKPAIIDYKNKTIYQEITLSEGAMVTLDFIMLIDGKSFKRKFIIDTRDKTVSVGGNHG